MEHGVDALGRELLAVGVELARIFVIVLVRPELHGIDEDGRDDDVAGTPRRAHERHVTLVERAHRRAEADRPAGHFLFFRIRDRFCDGRKNFEFTH